MRKDWLDYSDEVIEAKKQLKPIVALESTIISHGMPYPQNVQTAKEVEMIIRQNGAIPATIAIIEGRIKIGLSDAELELLATNDSIMKVSRRDFPYVIAAKKHGATTVAATMICAELAGIEVFVTGGIGGVHRGASETMDISADLQELAKTNVAVVCAGAKSILDIKLTAEYLETYGVPIIGYRTDKIPAFYTRKSPYNVTIRVDEIKEIAEIMKVKWGLGLNGGLVIANPIPEADAMNELEMNEMIDQALVHAEEEGISGKEITPFLLSMIKELTGGKSLAANIALVKHNAEIGAKLAMQL